MDKEKVLDSQSGREKRPEAQPGSEAPVDFLLEIGTEEIPAGYISPALDQLQAVAAQSLENARLPFEDIRTLATPRRLTLWIKGLATLQPDQVTEVVGPPKRVAYDADGNPTKAALGFANTQEVTLRI